MNIIISGGGGFIGSFLVPHLEAGGHHVSVWTRSHDLSSRPGVHAFFWNPTEGPPPPESLEGVDAVIHLAGESVAHKWTDELKQRIRDSRVLGTRHLVEGMARMSARPKTLVCSSATGYYGNRGDEELTETSAPGIGFLPEVCVAWEKEAVAAAQLGVRVVRMRTGMVLGPGGGALTRLASAFRSRMGGKLGSGKQWMAWIHMADIAGLYRFAAENDIDGAVNGTAPNPVRNEDFTVALADALDVSAKVSVPEFALKMMFGEMSEVMLASQKALPSAAERTGYRFQFPDVSAALKDAVSKA